MNKQTQKLFNLAIESIEYTWESKITLWLFEIKYRYWDFEIWKESSKIWIISDRIVYINDIIQRFQFRRSVSKGVWTLTDVVSKRISELRDEKEKADREKREVQNKLDTSENKVSDLEAKVESLKKEKDDLADKLAKAIVDMSTEPEESQKTKRRNNR